MKRKISRLDSVIMMYNIWICEDNDAHADMTFEQLIDALAKGGLMDTSLLEAALYCCNMNYENSRVGFHHPYGTDFKKWVTKLIGHDYDFDYIYNLITPKAGGYEKRKKTTDNR